MIARERALILACFPAVTPHSDVRTAEGKHHCSVRHSRVSGCRPRLIYWTGDPRDAYRTMPPTRPANTPPRSLAGQPASGIRGSAVANGPPPSIEPAAKECARPRAHQPGPLIGGVTSVHRRWKREVPSRPLGTSCSSRLARWVHQRLQPGAPWGLSTCDTGGALPPSPRPYGGSSELEYPFHDHHPRCWRFSGILQGQQRSASAGRFAGQGRRQAGRRKRSGWWLCATTKLSGRRMGSKRSKPLCRESVAGSMDRRNTRVENIRWGLPVKSLSRSGI